MPRPDRVSHVAATACVPARRYQDQLADVSEEDVQQVRCRFAAQLDATLANVRSVEPLVTKGGAPGTHAADLDGQGAVGLALPQAVVDELKHHALPILEKLEGVILWPLPGVAPTPAHPPRSDDLVLVLWGR